MGFWKFSSGIFFALYLVNTFSEMLFAVVIIYTSIFLFAEFDLNFKISFEKSNVTDSTNIKSNVGKPNKLSRIPIFISRF